MLAQHVDRKGFAVETTHDGDSGLKKALQGACFLVILDTIAAHEWLRGAAPSAGHLPGTVFHVTALGDSVDRCGRLQAGADDCDSQHVSRD